MLAYKTTRCPYCGTKIEVWKPYGINDYENELGEPYGYCYSCGMEYKTGKKRWSQMNIFTKSIVILKVVINIILSSCFISGVIFFIIITLRKFIFKDSFNWIEEINFFNSLLLLALFISPIISTLLIISLKQDIKKYN